MDKRDKDIHHRIQNFSMAGAKWDLGPAFLIFYAEKYVAAAKAVQTAERTQNGKWHPVSMFLAGHSIELSLKAFLGLKGKTLSDSKKVSHNLKKLLAEARTSGLLKTSKLSKEERFEIERASVYYGEKVFEYPSVWEAVHAYPESPDGDQLISAAEHLVVDLMQLCIEHDSGPKPSNIKIIAGKAPEER